MEPLQYFILGILFCYCLPLIEAIVTTLGTGLEVIQYKCQAKMAKTKIEVQKLQDETDDTKTNKVVGFRYEEEDEPDEED